MAEQENTHYATSDKYVVLGVDWCRCAAECTCGIVGTDIQVLDGWFTNLSKAEKYASLKRKEFPNCEITVELIDRIQWPKRIQNRRKQTGNEEKPYYRHEK